MAELAKRVVIADGAMGTMLQEADLPLDDFLQLEGCNEILNVTRPDVLERIHGEYLDTGIDAIETNTFGSNWSNLSDYGIEDRIEELVPSRRRDRSPDGREVRSGRRQDALGARLDRPRHEAAEPRPHHLCPPEGDLRRAGSRPHPRRIRRPARRDLAGPAADQGRGQRLQAGDRGDGHPRADLRRGDRRDHGHDAHGQRDRGGAHDARAARHRHDRSELRHRARPR